MPPNYSIAHLCSYSYILIGRETTEKLERVLIFIDPTSAAYKERLDHQVELMRHLFLHCIRARHYNEKLLQEFVENIPDVVQENNLHKLSLMLTDQLLLFRSIILDEEPHHSRPWVDVDPPHINCRCSFAELHSPA
jgi:hypothetical protein